MPTSYSQAGQDVFALSMMQQKSSIKTYLEIGSHDPTVFNNTYLLEQHGWMGVSMDIQNFHALYQEKRKNPFVCADATMIDWDSFFSAYPFQEVNTIDYLSFDVDDATFETFSRFPFDTVKFHVITIEHDAYRVGDDLKYFLREKLTAHGYTLLCADVVLEGYGKFEDWWVDASVVDPMLLPLAASDGKNYLDICAAISGTG